MTPKTHNTLIQMMLLTEVVSIGLIVSAQVTNTRDAMVIAQRPIVIGTITDMERGSRGGIPGSARNSV
jgi:hypothetical protein